MTDWIVAVSAAITALATLGALSVALWAAIEKRKSRAAKPPTCDVEASAEALSDLMGVLLVLLRLLTSEEAQRYRDEWGAHLYLLGEDSEHDEARRARRSFARRVVLMAVELRLRKLRSVLRRRLGR